MNSFADNLVCSVGESLPHEIDEAWRQKWDTVLVNQYFCELREAKKQGRKEKRHKEAQAVLAAATAAAAASSRSSAFRKDTLEESTAQEVVVTAYIYFGLIFSFPIISMQISLVDQIIDYVSVFLWDLLKLNSRNRRAGISSQVMSRAKETLSRLSTPRVSSEKYSNSVISVSGIPKEHSRSCDICRRVESILNPVLVYSSCKVIKLYPLLSLEFDI